ncbi:hypothetical protein DMB42_19885 [Nonomuraea sp. WAC 01424]|uniref:hypothetical protein n=1 Tax=Nonomuraea sp. WAC 01424 TaxID=2203200 RepID=UPI000F7917E1|nr:hypothetical protein [Nonomuraea sp. WAC 01424]RSN08317.1 hypothetical protein DMB42_19885 [Nonomuraea sp. WAC 01424]
MATNPGIEATGTSAEFRPEGTAAKVWAALTATPTASVMMIADAAGVSRPTATKALSAFAEAGRAIRTPGGRSEEGRALPDTWAPVITDDVRDQDGITHPIPDMAADAEAPAGPGTTDAATQDSSTTAISLPDAMRILEQEADRRAAAEAELARAQAEEEARRQQAAETLAKARLIEDRRRALTDLLNAVTTTYAALLTDDEAAFTTGLEAIYSGAADVRKVARTAQAKASAGWGSSRDGDRSASRPLRPDVAAHLMKHPSLAFTANEIAKVLSRSSGAVANALDTLARNGEAELVSERPNRFRAAKPQNA